jgi:hypothetical protein
MEPKSLLYPNQYHSQIAPGSWVLAPDPKAMASQFSTVACPANNAALPASSLLQEEDKQYKQ